MIYFYYSPLKLLIMPQKMLITNYNYNVSRQEYENTITQIAQAFADVPGCLWKIWMIDEEKKEAGAVYLFKDDESLQNFKASPLVASVLSHPALSNFDLKERDILKEVSEITRAPLQ
jgi:quinol monooxygenase YgiN